MGRVGIEERDEGGGTQRHRDLHRVAGGNACDRVEGEDLRLRLRRLLHSVVVSVIVDDGVQEEQSLADAIVPAAVLLVAVVAQAEATLFGLGEALHWAPLDRHRGRDRLGGMRQRCR